jgi:hypothetical protein
MFIPPDSVCSRSFTVFHWYFIGEAKMASMKDIWHPVSEVKEPLDNVILWFKGAVMPHQGHIAIHHDGKPEGYASMARGVVFTHYAVCEGPSESEA